MVDVKRDIHPTPSVRGLQPRRLVGRVQPATYSWRVSAALPAEHGQGMMPSRPRFAAAAAPTV
ncbi:conserved protein of unknown function [Ectopseudomonas oleovorans]|uniref:Uncharacterized protein n=1 Tax=Ectopseudomonas oleovorans TaxID=301 RepID=A0A653B889_ECTOL|nr:conserved protein of unknown function [Pseudomonas oleovorans]